MVCSTAVAEAAAAAGAGRARSRRALVDNDRSGSLVRAAAAGDRVAWDRLVDRFSGLLWSVALSYRLSQADAADVLQTTWLRLLENLDRLRDPDAVGAWLATTARHECLRTMRRLGRVIPVENDEQLDIGTNQMNTPEAAALESERDRLLWRAFAQLPERCQQLLRLVVVTAPPYEEVAAVMGMSVGSIGPTRARCLERLRRKLGGSGISANAGGS